MEDYKKIVDQLRSTKSESKRKLLDTAADLIERLVAKCKELDRDCNACAHIEVMVPCEATDKFLMCDTCDMDCVCKTCRDNSNWELGRL